MNIRKSAEKIADLKHIDTLNKLYGALPSGTCSGCAACCSESVNISFLEFSNILINGVFRLDHDAQNALRMRILSYYLLEWVKPQKCPFLNEEKKCIIYETRPLPCRLFGFSNQEDYEFNYAKVSNQNVSFAKRIQEQEHLLLPVSVVRKKIPFCRDFVPAFRLSRTKIESYYSTLVNLDGQLYFEAFIDDSVMNSDLVGLMMEYYLEHEGDASLSKELCLDLKFTALKHIQKD